MKESQADTTAAGSPVWAYVLCGMLVVVAFCLFGLSLDRYPAFYVDEPQFNASAVRTVGGLPFEYVFHSQAPHTDSVWANHAPFYPRMQILTFKLLGVSHYASRLPSYLGAQAGILLLCLYLLRRGFRWSAIGLAVFWLGDISIRQTMLGRPEGMSLFFAALGFVLLLEAIDRTRTKKERACWVWMTLAGVGLGMSAGFNPASSFLGLTACLAAVAMLSHGSRMRSVACLALGAVLPLALVLVCWGSDLSGSLEQFIWFVRYSTGHAVPSVGERLRSVGSVFGWGRPWVLGLVVATFSVLVPKGIRRWCLSRGSGLPRSGDAIVIVSTMFSLAALGMYVSSSMHPYYIVLFTPWPVVALLCAWESARQGKKERKLSVLAVLVLGLLWLPSLGWNMMRVREAILWRNVINRTPLVDAIRRHVPDGAPFMGDPIYYVTAHNAGRDFTPLPFYHDDTAMQVPPAAWLAVTERYRTILDEANPLFLSLRPIVFTGTLFPGSEYTRQPFYIYGPSGAP